MTENEDSKLDVWVIIITSLVAALVLINLSIELTILLLK